MCLLSLPLEILYCIDRLLTPTDRKSLYKTCKQLNSVQQCESERDRLLDVFDERLLYYENITKKIQYKEFYGRVMPCYKVDKGLYFTFFYYGCNTIKQESVFHVRLVKTSKIECKKPHTFCLQKKYSCKEVKSMVKLLPESLLKLLVSLIDCFVYCVFSDKLEQRKNPLDISVTYSAVLNDCYCDRVLKFLWSSVNDYVAQRNIQERIHGILSTCIACIQPIKKQSTHFEHVRVLQDSPLDFVRHGLSVKYSTLEDWSTIVLVSDNAFLNRCTLQALYRNMECRIHYDFWEYMQKKDVEGTTSFNVEMYFYSNSVLALEPTDQSFIHTVECMALLIYATLRFIQKDGVYYSVLKSVPLRMGLHCNFLNDNSMTVYTAIKATRLDSLLHDQAIEKLFSVLYPFIVASRNVLGYNVPIDMSQ